MLHIKMSRNRSRRNSSTRPTPNPNSIQRLPGHRIEFSSPPVIRSPTPIPVNAANDIPRPNLILTPDEFNFKCKLATHCKLAKEVKFIENCLKDHPDGLNWFKTSQFGHLFEVAPYIETCLSPLWMLLTRQVQMNKNLELWFVLNGIPIRYSLMEHTLISGLNSSPYPLEVLRGDGFEERFCEKKITLKFVRNMLSNFTIPAEEVGNISGSVREQERERLLLDKLKLAVLYFLASVLFSRRSENCEIDEALVEIVDDIDVARTYPWGRMSYCYLIKEVRNLNIKRLCSAANPQWTCCGFILPLMLLPFECIPAMSPSIGRVRDVNIGQLPRICYWNTQFILRKQAPSLGLILQVVGHSKNIRSILTLTAEEFQASHMQGFAPIDQYLPVITVDTTTDQWSVILENGDSIFFEDIWREDVEGRHSFLKKVTASEHIATPAQDNVPGGSTIPSESTNHVVTMLESLMENMSELRTDITLQNERLQRLEEKVEEVVKWTRPNHMEEEEHREHNVHNRNDNDDYVGQQYGGQDWDAADDDDPVGDDGDEHGI